MFDSTSFCYSTIEFLPVVFFSTIEFCLASVRQQAPNTLSYTPKAALGACSIRFRHGTSCPAPTDTHTHTHTHTRAVASYRINFVSQSPF